MTHNSHETTGRRGMNTRVHSSHDELCRNSGPRLVRVLQTHADRLTKAARLAANNPVRRMLLKILATHDNGVTYQTLIDALPVSERWVRELVADLRRQGIVETPGNPALVQFTSREIMVAVKEVVAFLSSDWVDHVASGAKTALSKLSVSMDNHVCEDYLKTMSGLLRG